MSTIPFRVYRAYKVGNFGVHKESRGKWIVRDLTTYRYVFEGKTMKECMAWIKSVKGGTP